MIYKEHRTLFKRLQLVADFSVLIGSFVLAAALDPALLAVPWLAPTVALVWLFFLDTNGLYYTYRTVRRRDLVVGIGKSFVQGGAVVATVLFLAEVEVERRGIVLFAGVAFSALVAQRFFVRWALGRVRERGWNFNSLLVVGTGDSGRELVSTIRRNPHWGIRVSGFLTTDRAALGTRFDDVPVLGAVTEFDRVLAETPIDEVAFALPEIPADRLSELLAVCEREGVKARVVADLYRPVSAQVVVEDLDGLPTVTFPVAPGVGWQLLCKEVFDRVGALALLVAMSPFIALIAGLIRFESRGPVFFAQKRVGLRKRPFLLYKFRTMVPDAEALRDELEVFNEVSPPAFKMSNDPRVTRVGRWLRRSSLDELPQLWNVLRGEMSFIGPRPPIPEEVAEYEGWQRRRLAMKPGISGLWQVVGRGKDLDFADWVRLDLEYIDNWSLALDFRILLLTVPTVLFGKGST